MPSINLIVRLLVAKQGAFSRKNLDLAQIRAKLAGAIVDAVPEFCYRHVSEPSGWVGSNEQEHCGEHFVVIKWKDRSVMSQELVLRLFSTNLFMRVARSFGCSLEKNDTLTKNGIYLEVFQKVDWFSTFQNQTV